jgi:hypothetical protein
VVAILAAVVAQTARLLALTKSENCFQRIKKRPTDLSSIVLLLRASAQQTVILEESFLMQARCFITKKIVPR